VIRVNITSPEGTKDVRTFCTSVRWNDRTGGHLISFVHRTVTAVWEERRTGPKIYVAGCSGCKLGERKYDLHILALETLGARVWEKCDFLCAEVPRFIHCINFF